MIRAEKSFATYSVLHGTKEAFFKFVNTTAIMFRNGKPVNSYQLLLAREKQPGALNWRTGAVSGDFGYNSSLGPFSRKPLLITLLPTAFFHCSEKEQRRRMEILPDAGTDTGSNARYICIDIKYWNVQRHREHNDGNRIRICRHV